MFSCFLGQIHLWLTDNLCEINRQNHVNIIYEYITRFPLYSSFYLIIWVHIKLIRPSIIKKFIETVYIFCILGINDEGIKFIENRTS